MAKRIGTKDLRAGSIGATPIDMDWSQETMNYDGLDDEKGWQFWEAQECQECGVRKVFHNGGGDERHRDISERSKCEGYYSMAEGPMMNYWYPIKDEPDLDPAKAALAIHDLPLCVVQVSGNWGFALTGGGMDLSWEICEAYTRIGQLPPVHFCNLPRMAGRGPNIGSYGDAKRDAYIMAACRASVRVQMMRAKWALKHLRDMSVKAAR
jgi:hypothetical protein